MVNKKQIEIDKLNIAKGVHTDRCPCAQCTLERMPVIDDPIIHEALVNAGIA